MGILKKLVKMVHGVSSAKGTLGIGQQDYRVGRGCRGCEYTNANGHPVSPRSQIGLLNACLLGVGSTFTPHATFVNLVACLEQPSICLTLRYAIWPFRTMSDLKDGCSTRTLSWRFSCSQEPQLAKNRHYT